MATFSLKYNSKRPLTFLFITTLAGLHEEKFGFAGQCWAPLSSKGSRHISDRNGYSVYAIQGSMDAVRQNAADKAVVV